MEHGSTAVWPTTTVTLTTATSNDGSRPSSEHHQLQQFTRLNSANRILYTTVHGRPETKHPVKPKLAKWMNPEMCEMVQHPDSAASTFETIMPII